MYDLGICTLVERMREVFRFGEQKGKKTSVKGSVQGTQPG